jgi:hypothetical protein
MFHLCYSCISDKTTDSFANLLALYPLFQSDFEEEWRKLKLCKLKGLDYAKAKLKLIMVDLFLGDEVDLPHGARDEIVAKIFADAHSNTTSWFEKVLSLVKGSVDDPLAKEYEQRAKDYEKRARKKSVDLDDITFLGGLTDVSKYGGNLAADQILITLRIASSLLIEELTQHSNRLKNKFHSIRHQVLTKQIVLLVSGKREELYAEWRLEFIQALHDAQREREGSPGRS